MHAKPTLHHQLPRQKTKHAAKGTSTYLTHRREVSCPRRRLNHHRIDVPNVPNIGRGLGIYLSGLRGAVTRGSWSPTAGDGWVGESSVSLEERTRRRREEGEKGENTRRTVPAGVVVVGRGHRRDGRGARTIGSTYAGNDVRPSGAGIRRPPPTGSRRLFGSGGSRAGRGRRDVRVAESRVCAREIGIGKERWTGGEIFGTSSRTTGGDVRPLLPARRRGRSGRKPPPPPLPRRRDDRIGEKRRRCPRNGGIACRRPAGERESAPSRVVCTRPMIDSLRTSSADGGTAAFGPLTGPLARTAGDGTRHSSLPFRRSPHLGGSP